MLAVQVMELAHLGEARAGSKCGRMDQCCALGANHVAAMFFDGEDVEIYEVGGFPCEGVPLTGGGGGGVRGWASSRESSSFARRMYR